MGEPKQNFLVKVIENLTQPDNQLVAQELSKAATASGSTLVQDLKRGQLIQVSGVINSATTRPEKSVPAYEIEIFDGSGIINAIWLGRSVVRGVIPGKYIAVEGRITFLSARPTIYNPYYTLLSREHD
ncbi:MAG: OB-fold nucleic acid binding domain-containing protein [Candidatus Nanopelagicales bacterium]